MKNYLLTAFAFFVCTYLNAQLRESGQIEFTPYIGSTTSYLTGDEVNDLNDRSSFNFGLRGDYYFNDRWSLRSGLNFDSMGMRTNTLEELQLDYINIPLNANWHFGSTRKWNLNFGITPGFLLKADFNGENLKDTIKSFQLGFSYGVGYKLEVTQKFSLLFDAQFLIGLTNILKNEGNLTNSNAGTSINIGGVFAL